MTTLCGEQSDFIVKVVSTDDRYHLLTGGAGTGKTTVVSEIMYKLAEEGSKVISIYPTHKAKYVGVERLREYVAEQGEEITLDKKYAKPGDEEVDDASVVLPEGEVVEFKTIHSFIGLVMRSVEGRTKKQTIQDGGKFLTNKLMLRDLGRSHGELVIFVDEISMIPLPYITLEYLNDEFEHSTIKAGGLIQLLEGTGVPFRVIFTGDFNQLLPVNRPMSEFTESFMSDAVSPHELKINHRAQAQPIVDVADYSFANAGKLPAAVNDPSVVFLDKPNAFVDKYLDYINEGKETTVLVFTNKARKKYENLAARKIYDEPDPMFEGNIVLSGETKTAAAGDGKVETLLYSQERVEIVEKNEIVTLRDTEWAENPVEIHPVTVRRLMDHSTHYFYGAMHVGESINPKIKAYKDEVSVSWNAIKKFSEDFPEHGLEELLNFTDEKYPKLHELLLTEEFYRLLSKGSTNRHYYNKNWSWNPDINAGWSSLVAASHTAAYLWRRFAVGIDESILPLKSDIAQTCHMAQGSGIDYVFVDTRDIKIALHVKNRQSQENFRRLMYVGLSRAKKQLIILR